MTAANHDDGAIDPLVEVASARAWPRATAAVESVAAGAVPRAFGGGPGAGLRARGGRQVHRRAAVEDGDAPRPRRDAGPAFVGDIADLTAEAAATRLGEAVREIAGYIGERDRFERRRALTTLRAGGAPGQTGDGRVPVDATPGPPHCEDLDVRGDRPDRRARIASMPTRSASTVSRRRPHRPRSGPEGRRPSPSRSRSPRTRAPGMYRGVICDPLRRARRSRARPTTGLWAPGR